MRQRFLAAEGGFDLAFKDRERLLEGVAVGCQAAGRDGSDRVLVYEVGSIDERLEIRKNLVSLI